MRECSAIVGVVAICFCTPAAAAKPRPGTLKLARAVSLENRRAAPLLNFEIVTPAKDDAPETLVGKLARPLAAGESASFPLNGGTGCVFRARWAFDDIKDSGDVDLCNDAHIVLID